MYAVGAVNAIVALGETNFRDYLPLMYSSYKDRASKTKPVKLKEVRALVKELFRTEEIENLEADDILSMASFRGSGLDSNFKLHSFIACTVDKDNLSVPGFVYNPLKETITDCRGFGSIRLETKINSRNVKSYKIKGEGRIWLAVQMITGDKADTYHGLPTYVTDYACYNLLKDCKNDKEVWEVVHSKYYEAYGNLSEWTTWDGKTIKGNYLDIMQTYFDVAFMKRWRDDTPNVRNMLQKMNIQTFE